MSQIILETERLILREMDADDCADLAEMFQDPRVMYAYEHEFSDEDVWAWLDRQTGRSVKEWIKETLLSRAKFLLLSTDKAVYQIADDLTFADASSFVQFFRTEEGIAPLQYRKLHG